jgi:excisionase family DNA binding protein
MKQQQFAPNQTLDERQFSILVGLCVATCREVLQSLGAQNAKGFGPVLGHAVTARPQEGGGEGDLRDSTTGTRSTLSVPRDHPETDQKLLLTVEEAARRLSIGRPKMYELVMHGEVVSIKMGASRRIPVQALEDYVRRLSAEAAEAARAAGAWAAAAADGVTAERRNGYDHSRTQ